MKRECERPTMTRYDSIMLSVTKATGNVGELAIASDLVNQGYDVFFPYGDVSHIDIIAVKENQVVKLQAKTVKSSKKGTVCLSHFTNRRSGLRYTTRNIDYMALYVIDRKVVAYVSMSEIEGHTTSFSLRFDPPKNGQRKGIKYFNDYLSVV